MQPNERIPSILRGDEYRVVATQERFSCAPEMRRRKYRTVSPDKQERACSAMARESIGHLDAEVSVNLYQSLNSIVAPQGAKEVVLSIRCAPER